MADNLVFMIENENTQIFRLNRQKAKPHTNKESTCLLIHVDNFASEKYLKKLRRVIATYNLIDIEE